MSNPKLKQMFARVEHQAKARQARYLRLNRISALAFLLSTATLLVFIPALLIPIGVLFLAGLIAWFGMQTSPEPDNEDPDGGWDAMWGNNCLTTLIVLMVGAYGLVTLLVGIAAAFLEHYLEIGVYAGALIVIFSAENVLKKTLRKPSQQIDDVDENCWICATESLKEGVFSCPICGFVSKAKNPYRGLCAHMDNMHHHAWRNTPLFKRLCDSCKDNRFIQTYLRSKGPAKFGQ